MDSNEVLTELKEWQLENKFIDIPNESINFSEKMEKKLDFITYSVGILCLISIGILGILLVVYMFVMLIRSSI